MSTDLEKSKSRSKELSIRIVELVQRQVDVRNLSNSEVLLALLSTSAFWQENVLCNELVENNRQRNLTASNEARAKQTTVLFYTDDDIVIHCKRCKADSRLGQVPTVADLLNVLNEHSQECPNQA